MALFLHAGRVLYRSHRQEAEQGEFCTEREAELGLATTAQHAPLVWKAPRNHRTRPRHPRETERPPPDKFRMQFPHGTNRCMSKNRRISTIRFQHLKYTQGNCMRNYCAGGAWPRHPRITGPGRGAGFGRLVGPARVGEATAQTNFAHNFPRSLFETARKRCNSNDVDSTFEVNAWELRATLMGGAGTGRALRRHAGDTPRGGF